MKNDVPRSIFISHARTPRRLEIVVPIRHGPVAASAGYLLARSVRFPPHRQDSEWSADILSETPNRVSGNNEPITPSVAKMGRLC